MFRQTCYPFVGCCFLTYLFMTLLLFLRDTGLTMQTTQMLRNVYVP